MNHTKGQKTSDRKQTRTDFMPSSTSVLPLLLPRERVVWLSMGAVNLEKEIIICMH